MLLCQLIFTQINNMVDNYTNYIAAVSSSSLYSSPNIVRAIKAWRMRWAEQVARIGEGRGVEGFRWEARRQETTGKT
jgi:hypothetical protein